ELPKEGNKSCAHWFDFCALLEHEADVINVCIDNAGQSKYQAGWHHYRPYIRREGEWEKNDSNSTYDGKKFIFKVRNVSNQFCVALYEPYDLERMLQVVNS